MSGYQFLSENSSFLDKIRNLSAWHHPKSPDVQHQGVVPYATYAPWLSDPHFMSLYESVKNHTLVDFYRCWELYTLGHQLAGLDGCYLEVGVWRGGTGAILADTVKDIAKPVYLADTFTGVVKVGDKDTVYRGGEHADTSVETVEDLMAGLGLANTQVLEGIFPDDTGNAVLGDIALLHCDVDVYESAAHIIDYAQHRLCQGGVIVFDDYGFDSCVGITRLVNELKDDSKWFFFHNLNGHALLFKK